MITGLTVRLFTRLRYLSKKKDGPGEIFDIYYFRTPDQTVKSRLLFLGISHFYLFYLAELQAHIVIRKHLSDTAGFQEGETVPAYITVVFATSVKSDSNSFSYTPQGERNASDILILSATIRRDMTFAAHDTIIAIYLWSLFENFRSRTTPFYRMFANVVNGCFSKRKKLLLRMLPVSLLGTRPFIVLSAGYRKTA